MINISVIIACYNSGKFIEECVESVMAQNLKGVEVICVDDASTDGSLLILEQLCLRYSNIKLITLNENGGPGHARNVALNLATGKYVYFVDSDDTIVPTTLTKLFEKAEEERSDLVSYGYYRQYGLSNVSPSEKWLYRLSSTKQEQLTDCLLLRNGFLPAPWTFLYSREFLVQNSIRFPEGIFFEDVAFVFSALFFARKITTLPEYLYVYRIRPSSITHYNHLSKRKICDYFKSCERIYETMLQHDLYNCLENEFIIRYLTFTYFQAFIDFVRLPKLRHDPELVRLFKSDHARMMLRKENIGLVSAISASLPMEDKFVRRFYKNAYLVLTLVRKSYHGSCLMLGLFFQFSDSLNRLQSLFKREIVKRKTEQT